MRQIKIISKDNQHDFEIQVNEFISKYPNATIQYQFSGYGTMSFRFTALIDYTINPEKVIPTIINEEIKQDD